MCSPCFESKLQDMTTQRRVNVSFFNFQNNFDVFNALDLMENTEFLSKLKFGIGDGNLNYYLYNWKCMDMKPSQVSKVFTNS